MMKNCGITVFVLGVTIVCIFIDINCSALSKESRKVHRNMEVRLNSFHNELLNALMEMDDIRENRGACLCTAPNTTVPDVNVDQPELTKTYKKDEIAGQTLSTYVKRVTSGFEEEKSARKRFEKHIRNMVKVHTKSQEHGIWTAWSAWDTCPVSCGVGLQRRTRTCTQPTPGPHGNPCVGDANEYRGCKTKSCAEPGIWTTWSNWGMCSVSCGIGLQRRTRTCTQSTPELHVYPCVGDASEYEVCLIGACADGSWSAWGSWGSCSATCNAGMRSRHRSCNNPTPSLLGKPCTGSSVKTEICNNQNCPNPLVYFAVNVPNGKLASFSRPLFQTVISNKGGGYNVGTAVFTAPVKGLYHFSMTFLHLSSSDIFCYLHHNNNRITVVDTESFDGIWASASVSVYLYLDLADTVDFRNCDRWEDIRTGTTGSIFTGALVMPS